MDPLDIRERLFVRNVKVYYETVSLVCGQCMRLLIVFTLIAILNIRAVILVLSAHCTHCFH